MVFLGSWEAANYYNIPWIHSFYARELSRPREVYVTNLPDRSRMIRYYKAEVAAARDKMSPEAWLKEAALAKDAPKKKRRSRRASLTRPSSFVHLLTADLPDGAFWQADDGTICASPELMFAQLCQDCEGILDAILIGNLMCAVRGGEPALTTVERLRDFVSQLRFVRGKARALDALTYVKNGYRSPMEVVGHMQFSLPHHLGGMCLQALSQVNALIWISSQDATALGQRDRCVHPDFYAPANRVIVEYQSKQHHSAPTEIVHDDRRKAILERMGYQVFFVRARDLYNLSRFHALCKKVARAMKKTIKVVSKKFLVLSSI